MAEEKKIAKKKRPTALKRDLQNKKRHARNQSNKSQIKTMIRSFEEATAKKESEDLLKNKLRLIFSLLDKGVKKGFVKKNSVDRKKSRLAKVIQKV